MQPCPMKFPKFLVCLALCFQGQVHCADRGSVDSGSLFLQKTGAIDSAPDIVNHAKEKGGGYEKGDELFSKQEEKNVKAGESFEVSAADLPIFFTSCAFTFLPFIVAVVLGMRATSYWSKPSPSQKTSLFRRVFLTHRNAVFAADAELAMRGAVFGVIAAMPFLFPQLFFLWKTGRYGASAVVMFVFTLYKSVGETVNFAFVGMIGTLLAVLNVWILFGIFPGGVSATSSDSVWYIGATNGILFGFFIIFLNFDNSLRMFALSWHVYFIMTFLNPAENTFNDSFSLSVTGPAVSALLMSGIGAGLAIIASLLPYPIFALDKARAGAWHATTEFAEIWDESLRCFGGEAKNRSLESALKRQLSGITADMDALAGHIGNAWWECWGRGKGQKVRIALMELERCLRESYNRLSTIQFTCTNCTYSANHRRVMKTLNRPLTALSRDAGQLMLFVTEAASDGHLDPSELHELDVRVGKVLQDMESVTQGFAQACRGLDENLIDVSAFCVSYCTYGRMATHFAHELKEKTMSAVPDSPSILSLFDRSVLTDKTHLNFVLRNGLSLLVSFIIGYHGYSAVLLSYNSGPAGTVSLLLSSFVGASIVKNLGRLQGAVLGTCIGQLAYVYLAWCTMFGYVSIGSFVFSWLLLTLFVYYNSATWGYIGCLLAAFAVQSALAGCNDDVFQPHGTYYMIINTIIGILCMTVCDFFLSPARSSELANEKLTKSWQLYVDSFAQLFDKRGTTVTFLHDDFQAELAGAGNFGVQATLEPRWWRTPFRGRLFNNTVEVGRRLREHLCNMEVGSTVNARDGSPKAAFLVEALQLDSFHVVHQDFQARMVTLKALLGIFHHETQQPFVSTVIPSEEDLNKRENLARSKELLNKFVQEAKSNMSFKAERTLVSPRCNSSLEDDKVCRLSLFIIALHAQLEQLTKLKQFILSA